MIKKNKPLILVVNDDGIDSNGIKVLSDTMRDIAEVFVVAPESDRSGVSHAMTLDADIYINNVNEEKNEFVCSGTPVDCVKLAVNKILPKLPDLCVSGINHGSNHSINVLYSGTVHGAIEGTIQGIPSISFSHLSYSDNTDLNPFKEVIKKLSIQVISNKPSKGMTLNVNFPDVPFHQIKGLKICKQGDGYWKEDFKFKKHNAKTSYYSITGEFKTREINPGTDSWALANNFISIVPITIDFTAYDRLNVLKYLAYDF